MENFVSPTNGRMVAALQELGFPEENIANLVTPDINTANVSEYELNLPPVARFNSVRISEYKLNLPIDQLVYGRRITKEDLAAFLETSEDERKFIYVSDTDNVFISGASWSDIYGHVIFPYVVAHECTCDYVVRWYSDCDFEESHDLCVLFAPSAQQASTTLEALAALIVGSLPPFAIQFASRGLPSQRGNPTLALSSNTLARLVAPPRRMASFHNLRIPEETCSALAEAHQNLTLVVDDCEFGDEGAAMVQSVTENRSVDAFHVSNGSPFSSANFRGFLNGLSCNTSLKGLTLKAFLLTEENWLDLIGALDKNSGLQSLKLGCKGINNELFGRLMEALSKHKSLKRLCLLQVIPEEENGDEDDTNLRQLRSELKVKRTRAVVSLLKKNQNILAIKMDDHDEELWTSDVLKLLKINKFRKHVQDIGAAPEESRLNALAAVLLVVKDDKDLVSLLLSEHGGLVAKAAARDAPFSSQQW